MNLEARQVAINVSGALLVCATLAGLCYMGWAIVNKEIAVNNKDAVMLLLGVLLAKYSDLIAFFYGSSHTNKKQEETMAKLAETAKQATQTASPAPSIPIAPGDQVTIKGEDT